MRTPSPLPPHLVDIIARTNRASDKIARERLQSPIASLRRTSSKKRDHCTDSPSGAVAALRKVRAKSPRANNAAIAALKRTAKPRRLAKYGSRSPKSER